MTLLEFDGNGVARYVLQQQQIATHAAVPWLRGPGDLEARTLEGLVVDERGGSVVVVHGMDTAVVEGVGGKPLT